MTVGLDIGGANLKVVLLPDEESVSRPWSSKVTFPMWQRQDQLSDTIEAIFNELNLFDAPHQIGVTMTGELADCFSSKREGVAYITDAVGNAARGSAIAFYQTDGNWCDGKSATENWELLAASNWHALARFGARFLPEQTGLMIDVGSTTTDLIPIISGYPRSIGTTDFTRLRNSELIYAGIGRTPICSLIQDVAVQDGRVPIARELFATMDDALIWSEKLSEEPSCNQSADGRPRTKVNAGHRLARMVCSDPHEIDIAVIDRLANSAIERYRVLLIDAVEKLMKRTGHSCSAVLLVGEGSILTDDILSAKFPELVRFHFSDVAGSMASTCGPAYAVASLLKGLSQPISTGV